MDSAICTESRSVTVPDILSSRLFCGEFDETPFMVEIGSFQQRLLEANTNKMALRNSIEIGRNECYNCLDVHSPNSNWPGATNFEYYSGPADIGVFHPFSNHSNNLELDHSSFSADDANSLVKECHSTYTNALPSRTNLPSENIATRISSSGLPVSMLRIVGGNSFVTQNTEDENRNVISKNYANYDKSWPEKGTTKDVERKCNKRKIVEQDINREIHCLKKKLCSGKRSVSNLPETSISGEMGITNANNFLTAGSFDIGSSIGPHSVHNMLITADPLDNTSLKPRAQRGSATDPQSVYARNRRERINRRLKLLQNLVPNGTKVNISTMLGQAIQYVKFIQLQIKLLTSDEHWMYTPISFRGMEFEVFQSRI